VNSHNSLFIKIFFFASVVSGCVAHQPSNDLGRLDFRVTGKLAVRNGADAFSASFVWEQAQGGYRIELWGPLGQGRTRLTGRRDELTIVTADGRTLVDRDVDSLMQRTLGWSAPVDVLPAWIRGHGAADWPVTQMQEDADSRSFRQIGWYVQLSRFRTVDGDRLPGRLVAERDGSRVTILMREWG